MTATTATLTRLRTWRPGGYLRASGVLFGWLALRTVAQMALFVLEARTLGAEGYGSLIAVIAIATLFTPLAGLGGQALLVREGARNPEHLATHLGDALGLWTISVVPLSPCPALPPARSSTHHVPATLRSTANCALAAVRSCLDVGLLAPCGDRGWRRWRLRQTCVPHPQRFVIQTGHVLGP